MGWGDHPQLIQNQRSRKRSSLGGLLIIVIEMQLR